MALTKISTGMLKQDAASSDLNIDAGTLYIDVSNNRVGVANTSPSETLDVDGNIVVSGTVDGRDLATDGTKLDGIESNADVTDTANVTAAGALMDSEVTNLAQVKAFDSADYATAAQGSTADSALQNVVEDTTPQLGGDLASNGNDILFADSDKAIFGAGSDLQIYHDGSHSFISDQGTGQLRILASQFQIMNAAGTESMVFGAQDNTATLYYDNAAKLATTSTGIDVTGSISADGLTVIGSDAALVASIGTDAQRVYITPDGTEINYNASGNSAGSHMFQTGNVNRLNIASNGDISFYEDTGTTAKLFWDASAESLGIGTTSPTKTLSLQWSSSDTDIAATLSGATAGAGLLLENTSTSGNTYANLDFRARNADGRIVYQYDGAANKGDFHFVTDNLGSPEAKFTIYNSGNVEANGTVTADSYKVGTTTVINSSRRMFAGPGTQTVNSDADISIREGNAFAGFDFHSTRTVGNIGGLRWYSTSSSSVPEAQLLVETDGALRFYNGGGGAENRVTVHSNGRVSINKSSAPYTDLEVGGTITSNRLILESTGDAGTNSVEHAFQVGPASQTNIIIDQNEVMARDNGSTASLNFNPDGGDVLFRNNQNGTMNLAMSGTVFMDQSRNLTNIGTISSGNITCGAISSGFIAASGYRVGDDYAIMKFQTPYFTHNTSNLACDLILGNDYLNTVLEVELTGAYSNQNATGLIRRRWYVGANANGSIWQTPITIDETMEGPIVSQLFVSDPFWDSSASTYKIRIYKKNNSGNSFRVLIKYFSNDQADALAANASMSGLLTNTSTASSHSVGTNANSGYRVAGTTVIDSSRNLTGIGTLSVGGSFTTRSGYLMHAKSTGPCRLLLEADSDNVTETDTVQIRMEQDGSAVNARIGFTAGNIFEIMNEYASSMVLGTSNATKLTIDTSGNATFTGSVTESSDERLKDDIKTLDGSKVYEMRGVSFTKDGRAGSGVVAQELEQVAPELVVHEGEYKSVAYGNLTGYLIEAIKEQQQKIEKLEELVEKLISEK